MVITFHHRMTAYAHFLLLLLRHTEVLTIIILSQIFVIQSFMKIRQKMSKKSSEKVIFVLKKSLTLQRFN